MPAIEETRAQSMNPNYNSRCWSGSQALTNHYNVSMLAPIQTIFQTVYTFIGFRIISPDLRIHPTEVEVPALHAEARDLLVRAGRSNGSELVKQDWRVSI
ncbi:hypothetical protein ETB97_000654 [Aspergillus alliaceus]|uniref:Uncharacterized protein n=1 Tax=Petromyces alliaceus TaxID=209559 RepID=A0A8H6AGD9_PETAA|nr:hypothetical protein ETB97_000654 [Aspergillus burnettii]